MMNLPSVSIKDVSLPRSETFAIELTAGFDSPSRTLSSPVKWISSPEVDFKTDEDLYLVLFGNREAPRYRIITEIDNERFLVLQPLLVYAIQDAPGEWVAYLIGSPTTKMPGDSAEDAIEALIEEIVDAFHIYSKEPSKLGPGPANEWAFLKRHLRYN